DFHVTGVQTCALPIWDGQRAAGVGRQSKGGRSAMTWDTGELLSLAALILLLASAAMRTIIWLRLLAIAANVLIVLVGLVAGDYRSEERRVGKECRTSL